jgi:hypothetical protein
MTARCCGRFGTAIAVRLLLAGVAVATAAPAASGQVITSTWTGVSGNWTNPTIWSTNPNYPNNGTPAGTTYNAVVNGPAVNTVAIDAPITVDQFTFQGGIIGGTADLTVAGAMSWFGGVLGGSGNVAVAGNSTIQSTTGSLPPMVTGRTVTLGGPQNTMSGQAGSQPELRFGNAGRLVIPPGATLNVAATSPAVFYDLSNGTASVSNAGTIRTQAGSGLFLQGMHFDNSGLIDISNGTLSVGGWFGGTGIVSGGHVYVDGGLTPGSGVGVMHVRSPISVNGGFLEVELNGTTPGTAYDQLDLSGGGSIALDNSFYPTSVHILLGYAPAPTDSFTIVTGGPVTGQFGNIFGSFFNGQNYSVRITYTPTSIILSDFQPASVVPEPAAWLLAGVAAIGWTLRRRSRR